MPRKDNANTPASAQAQQDAISEGIENFELPRALVTRIAKSAVRKRVHALTLRSKDKDNFI
jgi:DNA polymerase epsilon subunit 3